MSKKLFLIDGSAMYYRSYFAFSRNPLINSKGENTSATFGFLNSLLKIIDREHPEYLAIVFDTKEPTFRHKIYEQYKATREKMPDEMAAQFPRLVETLKAANFTLLEKDGYEADDIIGTLAARFASDEVDVYIVSGDKDMAQLVNGHVFLYNLKKQDEPEILDRQKIVEKYGVQPEQIVDWLALMGDKSDNIPGVPKVGEVTAAKLLQQFGSIENLYKNIDAISREALKKNLLAARDQVQIARRLTTIDTNVPIDVKLKDLKFRMWDMETVGPILQELEFRGLANRMKAMSLGQEEAMELRKFNSKDVRYQLIESEEEFDRLLDTLKEQKEFVFDLETSSLDFLEAEIAGISFCWDAGKASYVALGHEPRGLDCKKTLEKLREVFADPQIRKIGQNIKYDAMIMERHGVPVKNLYFDTMIASYLINPTGQHNLDYLAERYLNYKMIPIEDLIGKKGRNQKKMTDLAAGLVYQYACEDADITYRIYQILKKDLKKHGMESLFYELEMPIVHVLMQMEMHGVMVDQKLLEELSDQLGRKIKAIEQKVYQAAGEEFNLNSPQQRGVILFDRREIQKELGMRKPSKTKTGQYSTSEKTLERYASHPMVADIMEYRKLIKLKNTYLDALPQLINPRTGKIHTSYNQTVTATGRLSSSNPNLQNIPIRTDLGREIRRAFIPSKDDYLILSADYSQIELRIMAHLSGDETMITNFKKNLDIHAATAALIFGISVEEVTPEHRRKAKEINFGIIYGMSEYGLANRLNISADEAKEFIADYFATYPKIGEFMQRMIAEAREKGYVETMLGRRRYLPEIRNPNRQIREFAERTAINTPIQGSAADLIKKAMITIQTFIENQNFPAQMLLQVHDELVFEVQKKRSDEFANKVKELMEGAMELRVPLVVECGVGPNWLEAH
ncbi:DNA polymerase I [Caldithrix abyssi]